MFYNCGTRIVAFTLKQAPAQTFPTDPQRCVTGEVAAPARRQSVNCVRERFIANCCKKNVYVCGRGESSTARIFVIENFRLTGFVSCRYGFGIGFIQKPSSCFSFSASWITYSTFSSPTNAHVEFIKTKLKLGRLLQHVSVYKETNIREPVSA